MNLDPRCSIFIPTYNASKTIASVLRRIPEDTWPIIDRIYIINDGSQDDTAVVIEDLKDIFPKITLFSFSKNQGYGIAVRKGLELCVNADADHTICLHADGQYPPEKIKDFVNHMHKNNIDILQGSRHLHETALEGGMPVYKYIAGKCLVWLENLVFRLHMTDYHSGFMFYSRHALNTIPFNQLSRSFDFDLEMIAMARCHGLIISELGIPTHYRDEKSYLNPYTYGLRVLLVLIRYLAGTYNPSDSLKR